jgi:hypothetical protein
VEGHMRCRCPGRFHPGLLVFDEHVVRAGDGPAQGKAIADRYGPPGIEAKGASPKRSRKPGRNPCHEHGQALGRQGARVSIRERMSHPWMATSWTHMGRKARTGLMLTGW